jgi:hypothetical protein
LGELALRGITLAPVRPMFCAEIAESSPVVGNWMADRTPIRQQRRDRSVFVRGQPVTRRSPITARIRGEMPPADPLRAAQILLQGGGLTDRRGFWQRAEQYVRKHTIAEPLRKEHHLCGRSATRLSLQFAVLGHAGIQQQQRVAGRRLAASGFARGAQFLSGLCAASCAPLYSAISEWELAIDAEHPRARKRKLAR